MAECGLVGAHGRRKWRRGRKAGTAPGKDLIGRDFTAAASNQRWIADIADFKCRDGKLFLAGVVDLTTAVLRAGRCRPDKPPKLS